MATEEQAQVDQAQDDGAVQRLSKPHRPVIQMVGSGVFGTVMAATAAGLIVNHLPKPVQLPAFICLLVVLALTLSATWHWFFIVRPERITQKLHEEEALKGDTGENDELLDQQELADNESNEGKLDKNESDRGELDEDDLYEDDLDEAEPRL